ncbi:hypothetical protein R3W88_022720 [Solanum pinnatisectum]|uniref:Uncharacterized protein n=1 Tax=Solanum pinnatisectum TaxID=50273 RepID=A0AAV9LZD6_9SOLN|nr:hypothetical protein R3W88_022720 [Solanum pinnatisectum]
MLPTKRATLIISLVDIAYRSSSKLLSSAIDVTIHNRQVDVCQPGSKRQEKSTTEPKEEGVELGSLYNQKVRMGAK